MGQRPPGGGAVIDVITVVWSGATARDAVRAQQRHPPPATPAPPARTSAARTLAYLRDHDRPDGYTSAELAPLVGVSNAMINYTLKSRSGEVAIVAVRARRGRGRTANAYRITL